MEKTIEKRLDSITEDEVQRGFRIKEVPEPLRQAFREEGLPVLERVRLSRLNPSRRRKVNEAVQRQYHRDLQNKELLSNDQILKLVAERGEWSEEMDERIKVLQMETNRAMGELYLEGLTEEDWNTQLQTQAAEFRALIEKSELAEPEKIAVVEAFERWSEFSPERKAYFDAKYAAKQGREEYSAAKDLELVMNNCPNVAAIDCVNTIDDLKDKVVRFLELGKKRQELIQLQLKHAKIFAESVESRRDQCEELARLYYSAELVSETEKGTGPIAPTFEAVWDFPEDVIQWLLVENYFFSNGIPDAAREYLETFGFIKGARAVRSTSGASDPSDESPAPLSSRDDSPRAAEISVNSSGPLEVTTLTKPS